MTNLIKVFLAVFLLNVLCYNNIFASVFSLKSPDNTMEYVSEALYTILIMQGRTNSTTETLEGEPLKVKVYNSSGSLVLSIDEPDSSTIVNLSSFEVDTYSVEILTTEGIQNFGFENN